MTSIYLSLPLAVASRPLLSPAITRQLRPVWADGPGTHPWHYGCFEHRGPLTRRDPYFIIRHHTTDENRGPLFSLRLARRRTRLAYTGRDPAIGREFPNIADYLPFECYVELWKVRSQPGMLLPRLKETCGWRRQDRLPASS